MITLFSKTEFPRALDSVVWELTLWCCFHCVCCGSRAGEARPNELSTEECLDAVRQPAEPGCRRVNLIGGEVFLRPDWQEITAALTERGMAVCIITNGFVMTPEIQEGLTTLGIESVAVSLDEPERVHDRCRQAGSYRRPLAAISALRADNAPLLPEFYKTLCAYPIFAWQIQACSPMGNARDEALDTCFDPLNVIQFVAKIRQEAPPRCVIADDIGYYTPEETVIRGKRSVLFGGRRAGLSTLASIVWAMCGAMRV